MTTIYTNHTESSSARTAAEQIQILYVEDDHRFADLTTTVLEDEDDRFTIVTASTATEGLKLLDEDIDCIVSDYDMPGMDGIEFLRTVREEYADLPFILFTGKGSEEVASDAISAGVTDYLQKEAGTDQFTVLANRVQNAVERKRTRTALQQKEKRLDTLVSNAPVILFALDSDGVFTISKGEGLDRLGLDPGEVVGQSVFDVYADAEDITAAVERALGGEQVTTETAIDGVVFETTYRPVCDDDGTVTSVIGVAIDITGRKQRLQTAERERHKYKTLFETLPVAVARCEPVGGQPIVRDVNPAFEDTFDIDAERLEDDPLHEHILLADQADTADELNREILEHGQMETEVERDVGDETRLFQLNVALEESDDDQICGYAVYTDLTERRARERELESERRRFQTLFDQFSQPVAELVYEDDEPIVRQVNQAFEKTFGYDAGDLVGESLDDYIVPDDRTAEADALNERVQTTGELVCEEVTRETADGTRDFLLQNAVYADGTKTFAIYTDITERTERKRELEILRTAIDTAHVPIVLTDPNLEDNPVVYVNDAFEEVTGYTQSDVVGRNCRFLQGEQTRPEATARIREAIEAEEPVTVELRNYRKDGTMFWNRLSIQPVYDAEGSLIRYVASQEDITEPKERHERLVEQNERLDRFARVVSHDLRNPLQTASGRVELAREECESEHLDSAADALARSQRLIDDLLTTARSGTRVTETTAVDVRDVVKECWRTIESRDATFQIEIDTGEAISADRTRLQQLLENLMRNAVEHGGEAVRVTAGALDEGFYVEDDGPGIPADERDEVFDAGYSTTEDGTGFGLSIVKQVADAHGWEIRATDGSDGGARFEITGVEFTAE